MDQNLLHKPHDMHVYTMTRVSVITDLCLLTSASVFAKSNARFYDLIQSKVT